MPERFRAVFLSPHLDDAVFSCGGLIARRAAEGPVLVLNLFTAYPTPLKNRGVVLGPERYEEERAAARFLGFESRRLDEPDAVYRDPAYRSLGNLFHPPTPSDDAYLPRLREKVLRALSGMAWDTLYAPLGVGWHVDHVLTHRVAAGVPGETVYYEDAPYALLPHATRFRLRDLGTVETADDDRNRGETPFAAAWADLARAYMQTALMKNVKPRWLRAVGRPVVAAYLLRLLWRHRRPASPVQGWSSAVELIGPEFDRKVEAMSLYKSQFREFFVDRADAVTLLLSYARRITGGTAPVERYWARSPSRARVDPRRASV